MSTSLIYLLISLITFPQTFIFPNKSILRIFAINLFLSFLDTFVKGKRSCQNKIVNFKWYVKKKWTGLKSKIIICLLNLKEKNRWNVVNSFVHNLSSLIVVASKVGISPRRNCKLARCKYIAKMVLDLKAKMVFGFLNFLRKTSANY